MFEFKYQITSPFYFYPPNFVFQGDIPVRRALYEMSIFEYFKFNVETRGFEYVNTTRTSRPTTLVFGQGQTLSASYDVIKTEINDMPALKDEPYVWNFRDFASEMRFEISSIRIPEAMLFKDFSNSWENVCKLMWESENFGRPLKSRKVFGDDLQVAVTPDMTELQKMESVLKLVSSRVKHNDSRVLSIGDGMRKALKDGIGNSAQINGLLVCALKDAGLNAFPVAMSLRSRGRIPMTHPTLDRLNYFVAGVQDEQGNRYYMDATMRHPAPNALPVDCMVDKAICVFSETAFEWVDLTNISSNMSLTVIEAGFNSAGVLSGKISNSYMNASADEFLSARRKAKDDEGWIEKLDNNYALTATDYTQQVSSDGQLVAQEGYNFVKNGVRLEDNQRVTLNPFIIPDIPSNPFKAESRKLPIEFPYNYSVVQTVTIKIPDGYQVESMPSSSRVTFNDKEIQCLIQADQAGDVVRIAYRFQVNRWLYEMMIYNDLRDFWGKVAALNDAMLILKKV